MGLLIWYNVRDWYYKVIPEERADERTATRKTIRARSVSDGNSAPVADAPGSDSSAAGSGDCRGGGGADDSAGVYVVRRPLEGRGGQAQGGDVVRAAVLL